MALSEFDDPARPPSDADLAAVLGSAAAWWRALVDGTRSHAQDLDESWHFSGPTFGWSMRLVQGKRVLVYLTPQTGRLLVGVALGAKAIAHAEATGLASARTLGIVAEAPTYAEGRGVRFPVESDRDLEVAIELARIKLGR